MDQNQLDMAETDHAESNKYYLFMKKITLHFLLSVSLLSFFLSYNLHFSFFGSHSSAFFYPLFMRTIQRKYMFLVCNCIIVFLATKFTFSSSPTVLENKIGLLKGNEYDGKLIEMIVASIDDNEPTMERNEGPLQCLEFEEEKGEEDKDAIAEEEGEHGIPITTDGDYDGVEGGWTPNETTSIEQRNTFHLSTEELNKRFEEFIRKMKEEIRIEAQPQIIVV